MLGNDAFGCRNVTFASSFALDPYEVSVAEFGKFVEDGGTSSDQGAWGQQLDTGSGEPKAACGDSGDADCGAYPVCSCSN